MSKFSTIMGFVLGASLVILIMSTAFSWVAYIAWQGLVGSGPPFWVFWSAGSMVFIAACFLSTIRRY